jgi:hypothetical protein
VVKKPLTVDEFLRNVDWEEGYADPEELGVVPSGEPEEVPSDSSWAPTGEVEPPELPPELPPEAVPELPPEAVPEVVAEAPTTPDVHPPAFLQEPHAERYPPVYRGKPVDREAIAARQAQLEAVPTPTFDRPERVISPPEGHPMGRDERYSGKRRVPPGGETGLRPSYRLKQERVPYEPSPDNPPPHLYTWQELWDADKDRQHIAGRGDRGVIHSSKTWASSEDPNKMVEGVYSPDHGGYIHRDDYIDYRKWIASFGQEPAGKDLFEVYASEAAYGPKELKELVKIDPKDPESGYVEFGEKYKESIEELRDRDELKRNVNQLWDGKTVTSTVAVRDPTTGEPVLGPDGKPKVKEFGYMPPEWLLDEFQDITWSQLNRAKNTVARMKNDPSSFLISSGKGQRLDEEPTEVQKAAAEREKKRAKIITRMIALNASGEDISSSEALAHQFATLLFTEFSQSMRGGFYHEANISRLLGDYGPGSHEDADRWFQEFEGTMEGRQVIAHAPGGRVQWAPGQPEEWKIEVDASDEVKAMIWARAMLHGPLMRGDLSQEQVDLVYQTIQSVDKQTTEEAIASAPMTMMPVKRFLEDPLGHVTSGIQFAYTVLPALGWSGLVALSQVLQGDSGNKGEPQDDEWRAARQDHTIKKLSPLYLKLRDGKFIPAPEEMDKAFSKNALDNIEEGIGAAHNFLIGIAKMGGRARIAPGDVLYLMTAESRNFADENLREFLADEGLDDKELQQALFYNRNRSFMGDLDFAHREGDYGGVSPPGGFVEKLAEGIWEATRPMETESGYEMQSLYPWPSEYPARHTFKGAREFADYLSERRAVKIFASGQFGEAFKDNPELAAKMLHMYAKESRPKFDNQLGNWAYHTGQHFTVGLVAHLAASIDALAPRSWKTDEWLPDPVFRWLVEDVPDLAEFKNVREMSNWKLKNMPAMIGLDMVIFGGFFTGKAVKFGAKRLSKKNRAILQERVGNIRDLFDELGGEGVTKERVKEIAAEVERKTDDLLGMLKPEATDKIIAAALEKRIKKENERAEAQRGDAAVKQEIGSVKENPSAVKMQSEAPGSAALKVAGEVKNADVVSEIMEVVTLFGGKEKWPTEITKKLSEIQDLDALIKNIDSDLEGAHASAGGDAASYHHLTNVTEKMLESRRALELEIKDRHIELNDIVQEISSETRAAKGEVQPGYGETTGFKDPVSGTRELTSVEVNSMLSKLPYWQLMDDPVAGSVVGSHSTSGRGVLEFYIEHVIDPSYRAIAEKILPDIIDTNVHVTVDGMMVGPDAHGKSVRSVGDPRLRGVPGQNPIIGGLMGWEKANPLTGNPGSAHIQLRGASRAYTGLNARTILHEFLHAATERRIEGALSLLNGIASGKIKKKSLTSEQGKMVKAAQELEHLYEVVGSELNDFWSNLSPADKKIASSRGGGLVTDPRTGAEIHFDRLWFDAVVDTHELVSWGLTDKKFQTFLESSRLAVEKPKMPGLHYTGKAVPISAAAKKYLKSVSGTIYSQFAKLVRRLTGLEEVSNSVFMGVLEATEGLLGSGVSPTEAGLTKSYFALEGTGVHPQVVIEGSPAQRKAIQQGVIEYPSKAAGERSMQPKTPREALAGQRSIEAATKNIVTTLRGALSPKGAPYVLGAVAKSRKSFVESLRSLFPEENPLLRELMIKGDTIFNEMSLVAESVGPAARAKRRELNSSVKKLQKEIESASGNITDAVWDSINRLDESRRRGTKAREQAGKIQDKIDVTVDTAKRRKLEIQRDRLLNKAEMDWPAGEKTGYETKDISLEDRVRLSNSDEAQIVRIEADIATLEGELAAALKSKDKAKAADIRSQIDNYNRILDLAQVLQTKELPGAWKIGKKDVYTQRDAHSLRQREVVIQEVSEVLKGHYDKIKAARGGKVRWPDQGALSKLHKRGGQALFRNEQMIARLKGYDGRAARSKYISDVSVKGRAENLVAAGVTDPFVYAQLLKTTLNHWKSRRRVGDYVARARELSFAKGTDKAFEAVGALAEAKGQTVGEFLSEQGRMNVAYQLAEKGVKDPAVYAVLRLPDRLIGRFIKQAEGKVSKPFVLDRPSDHIRDLFVREVKAITEPYRDRKYSANTSALEFFGRRFFGDWTIDAASGKTTYDLIPSGQKIYAVGEFLHRPTAWIDMPGHFRDAFIFMNARNGGKSADAAINALSWIFVNNSGKLGPEFYGAERRLTGQETMGKDIARILTRPFVGKDANWSNIKHIERVLESVELANKESVSGYLNQLKSGYAFFARKNEANMASMLAHGAMKLKFDWTSKDGVTKTYTMNFAELQFKIGDRWYNRERLQQLVDSKKITRDVAYGQTTNMRFKPTRSWSKLDGAQKTILLFLNEHLVPIEKRLWEMQMQMHLAKDRLRLSIQDPLLTQVVDGAGKVIMTFPNTKKGQRKAFELAENTEGTTVRKHPGGQRVFGRHLRNDYFGDGIIKSSTWISEFFDGRFAMDLLWDLFELARDEKMGPAEFEGMLHILDKRYGKTLPRTKSLEAKQRNLRRRSVRASKKGRDKEAALLLEEAESLSTATGMIEYYKGSKDSPFTVTDLALDPFIERFDRMRRWGDLPFDQKLRHGLFDFREGASRTMAGLSHNVALSGFMVWMRENGILKTATELEAEGFRKLEEGFAFTKKDKGLHYTKLADDMVEWGNIPKGFHIEARAAKAIKEWNAIGKVSDGIIRKTWQYARDTWKLFQVANFVGGTMARAIIGNATQLGVMAPIMWSPKYALQYTKDVKTFRRTGKASDLYMEIRREGHGGVTFASEIVTPEAYLDWQFQAMNPKHEFWGQIGKFGDDSQKRVSTLIDFFSQDFSKKSSDGLVSATALDQMKQPLRKTAAGRQAEKPSIFSPRAIAGTAKAGAQKFYGFHREAFASIDDGFKGSYIYQLVKDHGWSVRDAIRMADKIFMDYRDIAPALNMIRSTPWALGEPFITFMIKWQFLTTEFMAQNPVKTWAMASLNEALTSANLAVLGWSREDLELYKKTVGEPGLFPGPAAGIERTTGKFGDVTDYPLTGPIALDRSLLGDPVNPFLPPMFSERKRLDEKRYRDQSPYPMGTNFGEDLKSAILTVAPAGGLAPAITEWVGMAPRYNKDDPWGKMMNDLTFNEGLGHVVNTVIKGVYGNWRSAVKAYSSYKGREVLGEDVGAIRTVTSFFGLTSEILDWRKPYRVYDKQTRRELEPLASELSILMKDSFSGKRLAEVRQDGADPFDYMMVQLEKAVTLGLRIEKIKMSRLPKKMALLSKVMENHENIMASYNKFIAEGKLYPLHELMVDKGLIPRDYNLNKGVKKDTSIEVKIIEKDNGTKEVFSRYEKGRKLTEREKDLSDRSPGRLHEAFIQDLITRGLRAEERLDVE